MIRKFVNFASKQAKTETSWRRFHQPFIAFQAPLSRNARPYGNHKYFNLSQAREFSIINSREDREELFIYFKKKFILARGVLVKRRYLILDFPIGGKYIHSYTFSDMCGHGAFLFLAISYLENDFMNLRM